MTYIKVKRPNVHFKLGEMYTVPDYYKHSTDILLDIYVGGKQTYSKIPRKYVEFITNETHPEYFLCM